MTTSKAYTEGCNLATAEIRRGEWTREQARMFLDGCARRTGDGELAQHAQGYDAVIQAYADNTLNLGAVL